MEYQKITIDNLAKILEANGYKTSKATGWPHHYINKGLSIYWDNDTDSIHLSKMFFDSIDIPKTKIGSFLKLIKAKELKINPLSVKKSKYWLIFSENECLIGRLYPSIYFTFKLEELIEGDLLSLAPTQYCYGDNKNIKCTDFFILRADGRVFEAVWHGEE